MNVNHLPSFINKGSPDDCAFGKSGHLRPKRGQLNPKLSQWQFGHVLVNRKSLTRMRHHGNYSLPCGDRDFARFLRNWKSANARQYQAAQPHVARADIFSLGKDESQISNRRDQGRGTVEIAFASPSSRPTQCGGEMCASSSAKEKSGKELGKGLRLVHKRPAGRGCGSRSPEGAPLRRWRPARATGL